MNVQFEIYIFMLLTVCLSTLLIINIQTELFQNLVRLAVPNPLKNVSRFVRFRLLRAKRIKKLALFFVFIFLYLKI